MTFAEFIEIIEYVIAGEDMGQLNYQIIKSLLTNFFTKVETYRLAHLTILIAKKS